MIEVDFGSAKLKFSITFEQLYELRIVEPQCYREFFDIYAQKKQNIFDMAIVLFAAYRCANLHSEHINSDMFFELFESHIEQVEKAYSELFYYKQNFDFFKKFHKNPKHSIKMPHYSFTDVEDCYSYYVLECGIPAADFWQRDIAFIENAAANKAAIDSYIAYMTEK